MEQDLFENLPLEIISNILSRLDFRAVASSKCVSKPWLNFLSSDAFVKLHFSRSAPALAVLMMELNSSRCTIFELEDDVESSHDHHLKHITEFNLPLCRVAIRGCANGKLLLLDYTRHAAVLYVCNPISREYIELHCTEEFLCPRVATYGFGVSKIGGHHKVMCIRGDSDYHVYTLGTGSWRRVEPPSASFCYHSERSDAFVNGNLHWLVSDSNNTWWISCFDLETECFSTFSVPPLQGSVELSALRDRVCLCIGSGDEIVIWLMKEYGDEKSWTKEYVIKDNDDYYGQCGNVCPIKVFKNGDILMLLDEELLLYYSNKKKTTQEIGCFHELENLTPTALTPSFLSLKSLGMEDVISF